MSLYPIFLGVPALLPAPTTALGFSCNGGGFLRATGRFSTWVIYCCVVILCWFIFQLTKVPLKLKSSVFTNILLCNILKLFPSIWTGPQVCCWDISTLYALETCYPEWLMEIIPAPGSKTMLSEREKRVYMETRVYSPLLGPAEMLSPAPSSYISPQHKGVPEHVPTTFQPISHSLQLSWLFLCTPLND